MLGLAAPLVAVGVPTPRAAADAYRGDGEAVFVRSYAKYIVPAHRVLVKFGSFDPNKEVVLRKSIRWAEGTRITLKPTLYFRVSKQSGIENAMVRYETSGATATDGGWPRISVRMATVDGQAVIEYTRRLDEHDSFMTSQRETHGHATIFNLLEREILTERISTGREYTLEIRSTPGERPVNGGEIEVVLWLWGIRQDSRWDSGLCGVASPL